MQKQKIKSILKYTLIVILALLIGLSLMLFPFLIQSKDSFTLKIGYGYLTTFIISSFIIFILLRKELRL